MEYEVELMLQVADMDIYYGIGQRLTSIIHLEDEIDRRFNEDFFDLLSTTLLYHQIIDYFLKSLFLINQFNIKLNLFPQKINENHCIDESFYALINKVNNGCEFRKKEEFIVLVKQFNKKRNLIAHEIIKNDMTKEKSVSELKDIKEKYHCIQEIYQEAATDFFNYVENNFTHTSMYLRKGKDYSKALKALDSNNIRNKYSEKAIEVVKKQIYEFKCFDNDKLHFHAGILNCLEEGK